MKGMAVCCTMALGLVLGTAATSQAGYWYPGSYVPVHYHHHYAPAVVVVPAPVYGYAAYPGYPPVVAPYPATVPVPVVLPAPYYYGAPGVVLGYRGRGFGIRVGF